MMPSAGHAFLPGRERLLALAQTEGESDDEGLRPWSAPAVEEIVAVMYESGL
jgi:hypothetical protein